MNNATKWTIGVFVAILLILFAISAFASESCQVLDQEGYWTYKTEKTYTEPICPDGYHLHNSGNWEQRCHRDDKKTKPEHKSPTCPENYSQDENTCSKSEEVQDTWVEPTYKEVTCEEENPVVVKKDDDDEEETLEVGYTQGVDKGKGDGLVKLQWKDIDNATKVIIAIAYDGIFSNGFHREIAKDDGKHWLELTGKAWVKIKGVGESDWSKIIMLEP